MKFTNKLTTKLLSLCLVTVSMLGMLLGFPTQAQAGPAETIQVLVAIDAQSILGKYCSYNFNTNTFYNCPGTEKFPSNIGEDKNKYIHMLVKDNNVISDQGGGELFFTASPGDTIEWSTDTFSRGSTYQAVLYDFYDWTKKDLLENVHYRTVEKCAVIPTDGKTIEAKSCGNPVTLAGIKFKKEYQDYFFWEADVRKRGKQAYSFYFTIIDDKGNVKGYYQWDPSISIQ